LSWRLPCKSDVTKKVNLESSRNEG
jgi:hypothetical protein